MILSRIFAVIDFIIGVLVTYYVFNAPPACFDCSLDVYFKSSLPIIILGIFGILLIISAIPLWVRTKWAKYFAIVSWIIGLLSPIIALYFKNVI